MAAAKTYIAIDLKSFYASVECVERGLDPLKANLVVADSSRTEKTICLAVSPSLKAYGIKGRSRLFEVISRVNEANSRRYAGKFRGESTDADELKDRSLAVYFITATPRMSLYMEYSRRIYGVYLNFVAPEDIHVYSVDEVFIDATDYLKLYKKTARQLAMEMILAVLEKTGITATAGIGMNLYLCKIAMDIEAKHTDPDENGVRIAELNERTYREKLWDHTPLTDFWRIGGGYSKCLENVGLKTMGDIARCSLGGPDDFYNEDLLYRIFGISAELLIDHAWGWEPCRIKDIKSYVPENSSLSSGQVLGSPYTFEKTKIILREMVASLALDLVDKALLTDQIVLTVGYDTDYTSLGYSGEVTFDRYGRSVPKRAHGSQNIGFATSSEKLMTAAAMSVFEKIVDPSLHVRRLYVVSNHITSEQELLSRPSFEQLDLFHDFEKTDEKKKALKREKNVQHAILKIQKKYGKNALLKGTNLQEGATAIERNGQVGGHKA